MKIEEAKAHLTLARKSVMLDDRDRAAFDLALWLMEREPLVRPAIFGNNVDARQALQDWEEDNPQP